MWQDKSEQIHGQRFDQRRTKTDSGDGKRPQVQAKNKTKPAYDEKNKAGYKKNKWKVKGLMREEA